MGQALVAGASTGVIYGLFALGLSLVYKTTRVLNFAQGEFGTLAAYVAWQAVVVWRLGWAVGALLAIASALTVALVFERLVVRRMMTASRMSLTVATAGLAYLLFALELKVWGPSPEVLPPPVRGAGLEVAGFFISPVRLVALAAGAVVGLFFWILFRRTRFGLAVLATAHDPVSVRLFGVPMARVSAFSWGAAGVLGAVGGVIIAPALGAFYPFALTFLFVRSLAAALVGGITSLPGAFFGGVLVGVLEALLNRVLPRSGVPEVGVLVVVLLVLLLRPQGIMGRRK